MTEYAISPAWRRNDPDLQSDAIRFWQTENILPPEVRPEARAKELCAVAHRGGETAGVATATVDDIPFLRSRIAMFRCAVGSAHQHGHLATQLTVYARTLLEQWSLEHPEENVRGMGLILDANLGEKGRLPVWTASGLTLVGYTQQGRQVRVAWFPHARVD
jgi:hypothetical protein